MKLLGFVLSVFALALVVPSPAHAQATGSFTIRNTGAPRIFIVLPTSVGANELVLRGQMTDPVNVIGGTAFEAVMTGGQVAAGAFGGPGASSAVGSLRGVGSAVPTEVNQQLQKLSQELQQINQDSEQFQALTNSQKAKHDAATAAIQNTR